MKKIKNILVTFDDGTAEVYTVGSPGDEIVEVEDGFLDLDEEPEPITPKKPTNNRKTSPQHLKTAILDVMEAGTGYTPAMIRQLLPAKWDTFKGKISWTMKDMCKGNEPALVYEDKHYWMTDHV